MKSSHEIPRRRTSTTSTAVALAILLTSTLAQAREQWTQAQARDWYASKPWLVGANYIPAYAINQLEMWQAETWDAKAIDRELALAHAIGMNTMRVFLHDLLWEQDAKGFKKRIDEFLTIARRHEIQPLFVLFDSVWDPLPKLGRQHPPVPGVHNSGWVQSPGMPGLRDTRRYAKHKAYVEGVIAAFAKDQRILGWDLWNEPDNGADQYPDQEGKEPLVRALLAQVFTWARAANPVQPLTSGVWRHDDWSPKADKLTALEQLQLAQSDVISFHDYGWPEGFERRVVQLQGYGRPILCTEYMARGAGSTFEGSLPVGKVLDVGMFNWGLVDGKTQTRFPWDSWKHPYDKEEPPIWFHEVFRADGTPYRTAETALIKRLAAAPRKVVPPSPVVQQVEAN